MATSTCDRTRQVVREQPAKLGLVPVLLPIASISPAPENDRVYRAIDLSDPDLRALAQSIRENGVREPLVLTLDRFILSGHRRYAAAKLAGLAAVPCRFEIIRRSDPEFLPLLVEYNRQRVKTVSEKAREEILLADPEESHRVLTEHRRAQAHIEGDFIVIEGQSRRCKISPAKGPFLAAIQAALEARRSFWPLTDRLIHYELLNAPPLIHAKKPDSTYQNDKASYKALTELATRARLAGLIPWNAIHDPTRPVQPWNFPQHVGPFIRAQADQFLKGYYRDLQQSQPNQLEIVGEKATIDSIIRPVAGEFCIPMTIGKGYSSLPPRYAMAQRFRRSGKENLVLLVLSDFDPEGEDIAHSFARSMRDDFGIPNVRAIKVALTADQVRAMNLPPRMKAKERSSRRSKFVDKHGDDVFELEAVAPQRLQAILKDAIDSILDVAAFNREVETEKQEARQLAGIRRALRDQLQDLLPPEDDE
jgi:hypothetical protein